MWISLLAIVTLKPLEYTYCASGIKSYCDMNKTGIFTLPLHK